MKKKKLKQPPTNGHAKVAGDHVKIVGEYGHINVNMMYPHESACPVLGPCTCGAAARRKSFETGSPGTKLMLLRQKGLASW